MTFNPEVSLGDIIQCGSFLVASLAVVLALLKFHRDARRTQRELTATALTAQLETLVQIQAMPEDKKNAAWKAIANAPGGPGDDSLIEEAIAIQVQILDQLAQGKEDKLPTGLRPGFSLSRASSSAFGGGTPSHELTHGDFSKEFIKTIPTYGRKI